MSMHGGSWTIQKSIPFLDTSINANVIINETKWPLSALKCCELPKVSIVTSHFTRNALAITR